MFKKVLASHSLKSVLTGSAQVLMSSILVKAVMFLTTVLIARSFGVAEFGKYGVVLTTVNMAVIFASMGLGMAATQYIACNKITDPVAASKILTMTEVSGVIGAAAISICMYFGAGYIAKSWLGAASVQSLLEIGCILLFANTIAGLKQAIMYGFEDFKGLVTSNSIVAAFTLIVMIVAMQGRSLNIVLVALGASYVFDAMIKHVRCQRLMKRYGISYRSDFADQFHIFYKACLPALFSGLCFTPALWYGKSLVVQYDGGFVEAGKFEAAYQILTVIMIATGAVCGALFPMMARVFEEPRLKELFGIGMLLVLGIPTLGLILFLLFSSQVVSLYGSGFEGLEQLMVLALLVAFLYSAWSLMSKIVILQNKMWMVFGGNVLWAFAVVFSARPLVENYGSKGLLLSILIAWFIVSVVFLFLNYRFFKNKMARA